MEEEKTQIDFSRLSVDGIRFLYIMYSDLGFMYYQKGELRKSLRYLKEVVVLFNVLSEYYKNNPKEQDRLLQDIQLHLIEIRKYINDISGKIIGMNYKDKELESEISSYNQKFYYGVDDYETYKTTGARLYNLNANVSAIFFLDRALNLKPEQCSIARLLGDIFRNTINDYSQAIRYYEQYIQYAPRNNDLATAYNTLGHLYERQSGYENLDRQIECFEKALEITPDLKSAIRNLTVVYPRAQRDEDALKCFEKLLQIGASMNDYFDYAAMKIKFKDFKEGWKYYEYRFSKENNPTVYPRMNKQKWRGQKIPEKTLLVQYEQGFGDSIQFFRYIKQLKALAGKVIFRVQDELVDLLKLNADGFEVVSMNTPIEKIKFDYHVALMSLMHYLNATVDDIPQPEGYLKAHEEKVAKYKKEFFDNDCLKIGISWQGAATGNKRRDLPLETFYPLSQMKNVKVYSFQKGVELKNMPYNVDITDLGSTFKDFSDTAAAMANVDLFVTSDNAVFQLAAAMGRKTFLLLSKDAEWRWFFDEETTPWYSNVRIFKKESELQGWNILMVRVIDAISKNKI